MEAGPALMRQLTRFPSPVNEKAARVVASGVALLGLITLATGWLWLIVLLAVGFAARVTSGPRFSLLGRAAVELAPRLGPPRFVPGPPKRFAQAIGLLITTVAAVAGLGFGAHGVALGLTGVLLVFATLESVFNFCAGCWLFYLLMKSGVIPEDVCVECARISLRFGDPGQAEQGN
jgi:Domain of unknown function (DUF4395)